MTNFTLAKAPGSDKTMLEVELNRCANPKHPHGAWHTATPLPGSWQCIERFKQWRNRKRWGCNCHA